MTRFTVAVSAIDVAPVNTLARSRPSPGTGRLHAAVGRGHTQRKARGPVVAATELGRAFSGLMAG